MNSTIHKPKREIAKSEAGNRALMVRSPYWWRILPWGERVFLVGLARMLRAGRESEDQGVARAAAKWERALGCFIKVRLMHEARRWQLVCMSCAGTRSSGQKPRGGTGSALRGGSRRSGAL
jgi:hypothetical protein